MIRSALAIASIVLLATLQPSGLASAGKKKLYRWVDDEGEVHYSDRVPAEESKRGRSVLDDRGLVVDEVEAAKTPEELEREERERKRRELEREKAQRQAKEDRMLLSTFQSEDDIIATRNAKIETIEDTINVAQRRVRKLEKDMLRLMQSAAEHELSGRTVPVKLQDKIVKTRQQIREAKQDIAEHRERQDHIRSRFERYIQRYRKLTETDADGEENKSAGG